MAYLIHDIKKHPLDDYPFYFCDANVWIIALQYFGEEETNPYQTFIEGIVNLNEEKDPKAIKRMNNQPKIIITSLVLSEIINAYMRNVAMKMNYGGGNEYKKYDFKSDYRDNPYSNYHQMLKDLISDLNAFSDYMILENDKFDTIKPFSFLSELLTIDADFNDLYYYQFLQGKNIPFLTNDKDCKFEDINIITANPKLLELSDL